MTNNVVVISDLHCGCQLGLCPPNGVTLDEGGTYQPSEQQRKVWGYWLMFWNDWVPMVTRGEPFDLVINGDTLDGVHHRSTHQISHNLKDQKHVAQEILEPVIEKAENLYVIRGTEAHVGPSGVLEEELARDLKAVPNDIGQHARYDLWKRIGDEGLIHILHHIGTTGSNAYEGTALTKELTEEWNEAARWGEEPPDVVVRSHRHRKYECRAPSRKGEAICIVTPGWQLKTPFVWKLPGGRLAPPQFGGILVRWGNEDNVFTRSRVWTIGRSKPE